MGGKPRPIKLTDEELFAELTERGYRVEVPALGKEMFLDRETESVRPRQAYKILVPESSFMFDKKWD